MSKKSQVFLNWDWKESPDLDKLAKLKDLGVFVYEDPALEGSDSFGFIFSNKELTKKEVKDISDEHHN